MNDSQSWTAGDMNREGTSFLRYASQMSTNNAVPAHEGYTPADPPVESPSLNISDKGNFASHIDTSTPIFRENDLPPYDLLITMVDLFFQYVNTWSPILHRQTTVDSLVGTAPLDEADRILLHAIVATSLRYAQDNRLDETSRARYYDASKQKVLLYGLEHSSVKALQALVSSASC